MTILDFNVSHNMELAKLDKKINEAISDALSQNHTKLAAAEIIGVLECVKLQFILSSTGE